MTDIQLLLLAYGEKIKSTSSNNTSNCYDPEKEKNPEKDKQAMLNLGFYLGLSKSQIEQ